MPARTYTESSLAHSTHNSESVVNESANSGLGGSDAAELLAKGQQLMEEGFFEKAVEVLREALEKTDEHDYQQRLDVLCPLSAASGRSGRLADCIGYAREAELLCVKAGRPQMLFVFLKYQGNAYGAIGEDRQAMEIYQRALELAKHERDYSRQASIYNNLGAIYRARGDHEEARNCLLLSQKLHEYNGDALGLRMVRHNLAVGELACGNLEAAEKAFTEAYDESRAAGDVHHEALACSGLADTHARRGSLELAERYFARSIKAMSETGQPQMLAEIGETWATTLLDSGYTERALALFEEAYRNAEAANSRRLQAKIGFAKSEALARLGRFEEAYVAASKARAIEKELSNEENERRLSTLRIIHENERALSEAQLERRLNKQLRESLEEANRLREEAETANRFKSEMLNIAAHDLRNPLGSIVSLLTLALDPDEGDAREEYLEIARKQSEETLEVLDRLLDSATIEAGEVDFRWSEADMRELAQRSLKRLSGELARKHQTIELTQSDAPMDVLVDLDRFDQILTNLLSNAIKYSPTGSTISVSLERYANNVRCSVRDQGPGIPKHEQIQLFKRFRRLTHSRPTGGEKSTGLGLYIAKRLTDLHGGNLWAESEGLGKGATFVLELPRLIS